MVSKLVCSHSHWKKSGWQTFLCSYCMILQSQSICFSSPLRGFWRISLFTITFVISSFPACVSLSPYCIFASDLCSQWSELPVVPQMTRPLLWPAGTSHYHSFSFIYSHLAQHTVWAEKKKSSVSVSGRTLLYSSLRFSSFLKGRNLFLPP